MEPIGFCFLSFGSLGEFCATLHSLKKNESTIMLILVYLFRFPKGSSYNNWTNTHLPAYIENSMVVGGAEWKRLIAGIKEAEIYAGINFAQKAGDNLYMAQALISPLGDELIFRHKLRPSGVERDIFSDGTIDQMKVITSAYGRVGMLECGEHQYPSMTFPMQA